MQIHHLEIFCKVVECRGVTRAAEALVMTQPAVSLHIRSLERSFGVKLFERRRNAMMPTPAADLLYRYATSIRELHILAQQGLDQFRHGFHGRIVLGVATGVLYMLPDFLRRYQAAVPGVKITLKSDNSDRIREDVRRGTLDLGLVWGPVADEGLEPQTIGSSEFFVMVPRNHELAGKNEVTSATLSRFPFVLGAEGTATRNFSESKLRDAGIVPMITAGLSTTEAMKSAVEAGIGLALLSAEAAHYEIQAGAIHPVRIKGITIHREVALVVVANKVKSSAVVRFVSAVREDSVLAHLGTRLPR